MPQQLPPPNEDELRSLYLDQGLSIYAVAKKYVVANETVKKWLLHYSIPIRSKQVQEALTRSKIANAEPTKLPHVEAEIVDDSEAKPSEDKSGRNPASPLVASPAASADDEVQTAFDLLKPSYQRLCVAYVDSLLNQDGATQEEIAKRASLSHDVLQRQLGEPLFMDAVMELFNPQFQFKGALGLKQLLLDKIASGTIPKGEWKTFAELLGLVNSQTNIFVGNMSFIHRDSRIRNRF